MPVKDRKRMSLEMEKAALEELEERRKCALLDYHEPKFNNAWKAQKELWASLDDDGRRDAIYGMVMADGAIKVPMLLKFFGIKKDDFEPYRDVHDMACAALHFKVQRNQISLAFYREDQIDLKYFLGRQFAQQVQNPAWEDTLSVEENSKTPTIVFGESVGLDPEKRAELENTLTAAMQGKLKRVK